MFLRNSAQWLKQRPLAMSGVVLLCATLPLLGWLACILVAMGTLMFGMRTGLWMLAFALLGHGAMALVLGVPLALVYQWMLGISVIWLAASVYAYCQTWILTIEVLTGVALLSVIGFHFWVGDVSAFWHQYYESKMQQMLALSAGLPSEAVVRDIVSNIRSSGLIAQFADFSTGALAARLLYGALLQVVLAKWWYALTEPAQSQTLSQGLLQIRNSYLMVAALLAAILLIAFGHAAGWDVLPLLLAPFVVAGVALVHRKTQSQTHRKWLLCAFYVGLILAAPYSLYAVVFAAVIDSLYDMRARWMRVAH